MTDISYSDPIIEKYLDLMKSTLGNSVKRYFNGIPRNVAKTECPALAIGITRTQARPYNTAEDLHQLDLTLVLIVNAGDNIKDHYRIDQGINQVNDMLTGRNSDYTLKTNSILHIIRTNKDVDLTNHLKTDVGSITVATPNEVVNTRVTDYWTAEGTIRFQAHFYQLYN